MGNANPLITEVFEEPAAGVRLCGVEVAVGVTQRFLGSVFLEIVAIVFWVSFYQPTRWALLLAGVIGLALATAWAGRFASRHLG
jgi:hypothetical protein